MERRFILAKARTTLRDAMIAEDADDLRATVVEREGEIVRLIPPRSNLWLEARTNPGLLSSARQKSCQDHHQAADRRRSHRQLRRLIDFAARDIRFARVAATLKIGQALCIWAISTNMHGPGHA